MKKEVKQIGKIKKTRDLPTFEQMRAMSIRDVLRYHVLIRGEEYLTNHNLFAERYWRIQGAKKISDLEDPKFASIKTIGSCIDHVKKEYEEELKKLN